MTRHEALLTTSPGYAAFVAEQQAIDEDLSLVEGFADWLVTPGEVDLFTGWTADQFREEWDRWNS